MAAVRKLQNCKTKTSREELERKLGVRWTPLLELDYYNAVEFHVIDPMHNLFLGTSKKILTFGSAAGY